MSEVDKITEKQYVCIINKLGKEMLNVKEVYKLTKKEASGIIKRNIIEHRPLHKWYIWKLNGKIYANTTRNILSNNEINLFKNYGIEISKALFLNKRLAEEYVGQKLIRKTPYKERLC